MDNRTPEEREYNFDSIKGLYLRREIEPEGGTLPKVLSQVESFRQKAPIGTIAPNFTGMLLDGGEFNLEQMRGTNVFLIFGNITCPPCVNNIATTKPSLTELYQKFRDQGIEFIWVYIRETHPGENFPSHKTLEQKINHARRFKEDEKVPFPIVVDSLNGKIHKMFGEGNPNSCFLITWTGHIAYKSMWLDSSDLPAVFDDMVEWQRVDHGQRIFKKSYTEQIRICRETYDPDCVAKVVHTLERSGPSSLREMEEFMGFSPLAWGSKEDNR